MIEFIKLKLKELYWTITRGMGLDPSCLNMYRYKYIVLKTGLFPIYLLAAECLYRTRVRFIEAVFEGAPYGILEHVGQCAMDFDSYLKDQVLLKRKVVPVFLCAGRTPANEALMTHWSEHIHFIRNRWLELLLRPLMTFPRIVDSISVYGAVRRGAARSFDVQQRWGDRPPLLTLSEAEIARGDAQLRLLGLPEGAWFVCIHSREGGYIPAAEWQHSFRNSAIADYSEAMRTIVARGGWCVRMGDATMRPLDPMPGVVDYALSAAKSDWMDLFLGAKCRFFLGNTSGLFGLAGIFGRPSALANMTPLGCAYGPYPSTLSTPKLLMDAEGRKLPFPDVFASEASQFTSTTEFVEYGLRHVDNTPEEIAELAIEMMDRIEGGLVDRPEDDDLQTRFNALMRPHHLSWPGPGRIGAAFLRQHHALLDGAGRSDFAPPYEPLLKA